MVPLLGSRCCWECLQLRRLRRFPGLQVQHASSKAPGLTSLLQPSGSFLRMIPDTSTNWAQGTLIDHIPPTRNRDEWELREEEKIQIRWHGKFRKGYYSSGSLRAVCWG